MKYTFLIFLNLFCQISFAQIVTNEVKDLEEIRGNWIKVDGSNDWDYGIYENIIIYKNDIWNISSVSFKKKNYQILINKNNVQDSIYIQIAKNNQLLIGTSPKNLNKYSRKMISDLSISTLRDEDLKDQLFKQDTAVYIGYINDYSSELGTTCLVHVEDIILGIQNSILININNDGTFKAKIPLNYPQEIFTNSFGFPLKVFLTPGDTIVQYIEKSEYSHPYTNFSDILKRERKSLFMGDNSQINFDLQSVDSIYYFDFSSIINGAILEMTPDDYKEYCLNVMLEEQKALNRYSKQHPISSSALQLKKIDIQFNAYINILSYNKYRSNALNKLNLNDTLNSKAFKNLLSTDFYDFIDSDLINNPIALVTGVSYGRLINKIRYKDGIKIAYNLPFKVMLDSIEKNNVIITTEEKEVLTDLSVCESINERNRIFIQTNAVMERFAKNNPDLIMLMSLYDEEKLRGIALQAYFNLSDGFAFDLMLTQSKYESMERFQKPLSEFDKEVLNNNISNPFLTNYLLGYSSGKEKKLAANKTKTGYVINETPKTEGDKLFDTIMGKYKGKVVFVDFWATWCSSCRSGMEKIKPLKEELKDEDIVFVYITNQSSPMDTWNMLIPHIKGEHYRVEKDEWNHFVSKFNISGIPHYVLVDKNGTVVNDKVYFASSNEILKKLFNEYLIQ